MPVTLELRLLLLALALRGEAVSPPASPHPEPPSETCGAALADVLRRLRELEGHVRALRGHCGDTGGPQAGTGQSVQLCAPPAGGGCACPAPSGEAPPPAPPPVPPPACPRGCSDQGRCERGRCRCFPGYSGPDCSSPACPPGWGGARCDIEVPWVTPRLASRTPTSLRITWPQPFVPPDGYRVTLVPLDDPVAMTTHELPSSAVAFSVTGLSPGRPFELLVQARRGPHLGAPGVLRLRTALIPPVPHYEGPPGSPQGSLGSPAVAPSARGPPESPGFPGSPGSPGSPVSPISPELSLGSPGSLGSPASPKVPASPVARGSLGSPAPPRSSVSPDSPESPASPELPESSVSPDFSESPVSPESPSSPELPGSPESPVFPGSPPPPPWSPVSPWPPLSPGIPSLPDLVARLSMYSGSLLQRLESHLRATNFPLRGNQTVPEVARAILAYIQRQQPALGRGQEPTVKAEQEELHPSRPILGDLSATSITPSSMRLQWSVPEDSFDSFMLQYRDDQGQPQALPIDGGSRSVTVPGLSPSRRYRFHLYGLRGGRRIDRVSIDVITAAEEPEELPLPSEELQYEKSQTEAPTSVASPAQAVLGELRVSSVTPSSVQLQWSVPEGSFDSFTLQYRDDQGQPQALPIDGGSRSVTVPGLSPSRRYRFHLYGLRGRKKINHVSTEAMTAAAEPEELPLPSEKPPYEKHRVESPASEVLPVRAVLGELRVSSVSPDSVQLQWSVPEGSFDSFTLQYRDDQGQPQALPIDGRSRSVTVPGLSPSHRYRFHLYGLRGRKKIDHVSTEAVTGTEEQEELPVPSEEQKHEKLQTETPPSASPPVLGELRISSVTPSSVELQWSVPEGSFDSFTLQYRDDQGQPQALPIDGGSRSVTVPGLSPSRRYRFHLYGMQGRKKTDRVSIDIITGPAEEPEELPLPTDESQDEKSQAETPISEAPPAIPVLEELRASSVTPSSVQLQWRVPKGSFDSFMLQYRDDQGQPQALPIDGGSRSVTVPELSPSHRYRFHLYGLRGRKKINHVSTEVMTGAAEEPEELPLPTEEPQDEKPQTQTPASEAPPALPVLEELRTSSVTPSSVQLQWSVPKGSFDSFILQYRDDQGQPQALPIDGRSRSVTVPGLSPSHRYRFHLYGLRGGKRIDRVSTDTVTASKELSPSVEPQQEQPKTESPTSVAPQQRAVLEELRASSVTPNSVQLQWSVPKGSFDSFTLQYRDDQGQPQALPIDGGSRSVTVPELSPSHRYRFHLYGLRGRKKITHVSTEVMTGTAEDPEELPLPTEEPQDEKPQTEAPTSEAPPALPVLEELRVSSVTPSSVQLQWSVPKGSFDSFMLQYRDDQGQPQALPIDGRSRSVTVPELSPSHRYRFHLYGLRGRKKITHVSTEVMTGTAEDPEELPLPTEEPQDEKPQTEAPTSEAPPALPVLEELRVSSVTPSSVQLQWSVPKGSFDSFMLQYRDDQGQPQALPIDGGSRSVTVPELSPSHRYRFHLYGLRGRKKINHVSTEVMTGPAEEPQEQPLTTEEPQEEKLQTAPVSQAPPALPMLEELRASSVTPSSVELQWSVPKGSFDSFMLQYRDDQGQPQALPIDGRSRSVTVPELSPSHRYRFHLYGLRGRKKINHVSTEVMTGPAEEPEELPLPTDESQDEKSQTEAPTSEAPPALPVLEELRVSSVTPSSVQLQWSVPKGSFDSFMLQYRDDQGQPQALPIDGGSRSVTVPELSPSHRYRFHLYGLRGRKKINHVSTEVMTGPAEEPQEQPLTTEEPQEEKLQTAPVSQAPPAVPVLEELRGSSVTPSSVELQWSVPKGSFDSFMLQYRDDQGQPQALPIDGRSRSVTVPGLSPSHRYRFHLYGLRGRKKINHVSTEVMTGPAEDPEELPLPTDESQDEKSQTETPTSEAPPALPVLEELRASSVTPNFVQLQWSVPKGSFDSFTLQYRDDQGQPQALPIDGGSRSVTVPELSPSHRYRFHLYGLRGRKKINHVSTEVMTGAAEEPEGLPLPTEEPQDEKLQTQTPASEAPPAVPVLEELRASSVTPNSVQLQWSVPKGSFDSFTLQYRDDQGQPQALPIDGGSNSVTVPGLSPSHRYRFHLYGLQGRKKINHVSTEVMTGPAEEPQELPLPTDESQDEKSQAETPTSEAPPAIPVLEELRVSSVTPSSVQLQWSVPKGSFDSFTLQYRDDQGQPQALPIDGGSRSVMVPGLSPSHRYRFHLYGLRGRKKINHVSTEVMTGPAEEPQELPLPTDESQDEKSQAETPTSEAPPAIPVLEELRVSSVTPSSVQLQWSVPKGSFDSFTLQYRDDQGQPQALPIDGGSRSVMVPGLSPSHRYRFHLYGLRGRKKINHVSTEVMTGAAEEPEELPLPTEETQDEKSQTQTPASEAPPARPVLEELRASSVTPSSVQLQWSVPKGSFDSFMLQYRDDQGQPQALPIDGRSRSVTVPGLSPSHRYRFHLYGLRGGKRIDRVSTDTVTANPEDLPSPSMDSTNEASTAEATTAVNHKPEHPRSEAPLARAELGELKVSSVTTDSVRLQWSVLEGPFDSFTLQYWDVQGQPQVLPIDGGSRSVTVTGLSPSHRYIFHLYGMHRGKRIDHVSINAITALTDKQEEPALPSEELQSEAPPTEDSQPEHLQTEAPLVRAVLGELRVSSVTPDSVQLQWSVPKGSFDSFTLQYHDDQGQPQALPIDGGSRLVTVPGLSPSHRYRFHLYGLRGGRRTDRVSTDIVTAAAKPEELPLPSEEPETDAISSDALPTRAVLGELRVSSVTPSSVQLQWSVPEGSFDSFMLQYRDDQGQPQALPIDGGSHSVTVLGLSPSHRYRFHLYGLQGGKRIDHTSTNVITDAAVPEQLPLPSEESQPEDNRPEQPQTEQPQIEVNQRLLVLGKLRVSSVTAKSVELQWSVPEGPFDSFMLQYRDDQGQPQALPIDGGSRSVTVPGLSPSHRYHFHLYGLRGKKRIDRVSTYVVTANPEDLPSPSMDSTNEASTAEDHLTTHPQVKAPPSEAPSLARAVLGELKVSSVGPNSAQLQWSIAEGSFDSFTLQYRDDQGQPQALPIDGGSRTVTVPGLSPSHRYRFHLYGLRGGKRTDRISTDIITAAAVPEEFPLSSEEPQDKKQQTEAPPSATTRARAVLKELRVSSTSPDSVQLQWGVPEGPFDSFTLQYRDDQGQPQSLPIDGGARSVTVPGLSPSHWYRFQLYGLRGGKRVYHASTEAVTAAANLEEPPMPSEELQPKDPQPKDLPVETPSADTPLARAVLGELKVSNVTPSSVQLQWNVPKGSFDSFTLQYRDAQGQPQALPIDGGSRSVTVPGLSPSHRYRFHLYGLQGGKRIDRVSTDTVTAKTEELPLPSEEPQPEDSKEEDTPTEATTSEAPSLARAVLGELRVSSVTPSSVGLQWSVPKGSFDSFTLQYRDDQGQPQALPIDGRSRSVTVPGLSPSHRYRFHLYGLQGGKRIDHVSTEAITGTPGTLWVGSVWPRSAWLHWDPPHTPPDGYELEYGPPGEPQQTLWLPPEATSQQLWGLEPAGRYRVRLWGRGEDPPTTPLEATFDTPPLPYPHPRDCAEEQLNGPGPSRETLIFLRGDPARGLRVFCDMETDGGGWLVFQRRQDGSTDFWRGWESYARGFGNVSGEFWLGNEALHELTAGARTELRVDLRTARDSAFALYRDFSVGSAQERYRLRVGAFSGTAGDALSYHSGSPFSTRDRDSRDPRDRRDPSGRPRPPPCAVAYGGAWWYRNCHFANLNGRYGMPRDHQGIHWFPWKGFNVSIPFTEMKLRPQRG